MWPFRNLDPSHFSDPDRGSSPGIQIYSSKDLMHWTPGNWLVKSSDLPDNCPYKHRFWAPEIHRGRDGRFYLVFTADNWIDSKYNVDSKPGYHVFIGVADRVAGPYRHINVLPGSMCDTTLLFDDDGRVYSYQPSMDMFVQQVDLSGIDHDKVVCIGQRTKIFDRLGSSSGGQAPEYLEGPWAMKAHGKYYLFYAELYKPYGYWTGVAYADNPMGPWVKDAREKVFWGGHLAVFTGPDGRNWFSYRGEKDDSTRGRLCIDPFDIDQQGSVQPFGSITTLQTVSAHMRGGT